MTEDTRTPFRREMDEWQAKNPRDEMALWLFAGWVNVPVGQIPKTMKGHTCPATMEAWGRVADNARAFLEKEAEDQVARWREQNPEIAALWKQGKSGDET